MNTTKKIEQTLGKYLVDLSTDPKVDKFSVKTILGIAYIKIINKAENYESFHIMAYTDEGQLKLNVIKKLTKESKKDYFQLFTLAGFTQHETADIFDVSPSFVLRTMHVQMPQKTVGPKARHFPF